MKCFFNIERPGIRLGFIFIISSFFAIFLGDWLGISFSEVSFGCLNNILNKNIGYNSPGLGTLILTNSLVGLGLVLAVYSLINPQYKKNFNKIKKIPASLNWFWMIPFIFFTYSIIFSFIKLLIYNLGVNNKIAALSAIYFGLGVISLIIWFANLGLYKTKELNER